MWSTSVVGTIDSPGRRRIRRNLKGTTMTTAIVHPRRAWMPALNLVLAGGAVALGVIAITSDDVGSTTPVPASPVAAVPSADFLDEVAAVDACQHARANEPC